MVIHAGEIISGIDVPRPRQEELLEGLQRTRTERSYYPAEGYLYKELLSARDGNELEVVREYPRPVGDEVVLREGDISIAAGDHLRKIAMHDAEAARKVGCFRGEDRVGGGRSDQRVDGRAIPCPSSRFADGIRERDPCAGPYDIDEAMNPEGVAFAHQQRRTAILRKEVRLRLDHGGLPQLSQGLRSSHDDVRVKAGLPADVEREVPQGDASREDHLDDGGLGQGHHHDIVDVEIGVVRLRLGPRRECADDIVAEQHHQMVAFRKNHQARGRTDPTNNVRDGVRVTGERSNTGRLLRDDRPY